MFESARTIGNLSRFDDVKDFLISKNIIQILCVLLQHTIRGIAYNLLLYIVMHLWEYWLIY